MKIINVTHGELTPEEKTAINVLANIKCEELSCEFCPLNVGNFQQCISDDAKRLMLKKGW